MATQWLEVIVSSPNKFHFEQASSCIRHGIPVLVEKPITINAEEGELLVSLSEQHKVPVLVGHHRAHSPILEKAREIIHSGKLGKLVTVTGSAQFYKPESYFRAGVWRTEPGGGPILINLIHEIGNLRSMCGEISAVHAFASSTTRNFAVEDTVSINIMFNSGVIGNFILSDTAASARSWEHTSGENPDYPMSSDEDCYFIAGTKGSLAVPTFRVKYYADEDTPSWWTPMNNEIVEFQREDPLIRQFDHFVKGICDEFKDFDEHAEPVETAIPYISISRRIDSPSIYSKVIFALPG